jgi:hypothetical protein
MTRSLGGVYPVGLERDSRDEPEIGSIEDVIKFDKAPGLSFTRLVAAKVDELPLKKMNWANLLLAMIATLKAKGLSSPGRGVKGHDAAAPLIFPWLRPGDRSGLELGDYLVGDRLIYGKGHFLLLAAEARKSGVGWRGGLLFELYPGSFALRVVRRTSAGRVTGLAALPAHAFGLNGWRCAAKQVSEFRVDLFALFDEGFYCRDLLVEAHVLSYMYK